MEEKSGRRWPEMRRREGMAGDEEETMTRRRRRSGAGDEEERRRRLDAEEVGVEEEEEEEEERMEEMCRGGREVGGDKGSGVPFRTLEAGRLAVSHHLMRHNYFFP
jgi:hypothetical protein